MTCDPEGLKPRYAAMSATEFNAIRRSDLTEQGAAAYDRELARRQSPEWLAEEARQLKVFEEREELDRQWRGRRRPVSITIVGWLLIVLSVVGAIFAYQLSQVAVLLLGGLLQLIIGIAILKGRNWARILLLLLAATAVLLVITGRTAPSLGLIVLVPCAVVLLRRDASRYFRFPEWYRTRSQAASNPEKEEAQR